MLTSPSASLFRTVSNIDPVLAALARLSAVSPSFDIEVAASETTMLFSPTLMIPLPDADEASEVEDAEATPCDDCRRDSPSFSASYISSSVTFGPLPLLVEAGSPDDRAKFNRDCWFFGRSGLGTSPFETSSESFRG